MRTIEYRGTLDGGLPVRCTGYAERGSVTIESVYVDDVLSLQRGDVRQTRRDFDIYESLSPTAIDLLEEQAAEELAEVA